MVSLLIQSVQDVSFHLTGQIKLNSDAPYAFMDELERLLPKSRGISYIPGQPNPLIWTCAHTWLIFTEPTLKLFIIFQIFPLHFPLKLTAKWIQRLFNNTLLRNVCGVCLKLIYSQRFDCNARRQRSESVLTSQHNHVVHFLFTFPSFLILSKPNFHFTVSM